MSGLVVFSSLDEAKRFGFEVYDRLTDGYLVRKRFETGWQMALVADKPNPTLKERDDSPHLHHRSDFDPEC